MATLLNRQVFPAEQEYPRNQWYVAAFREELGRQPLARVLLDTPVVLYRLEDGSPVALYDRCPHRGLPLSMGRLQGDRLQCNYHGIEFSGEGRAVHIPQQTKIYPNFCVRAFPLVEKGPYVFIWMGEAAADPALLPGDKWISLEDPAEVVVPYEMMELNCNFQFMVDNLADASHVSFLHEGLLDGGDLGDSTFRMERGEQEFSMIREIPEVTLPGPIAAMFRAKPDHPYRKVFISGSFMPSIHIGRQTLHDLVDADAPPVEFMVMNAVTPSTRRTAFMFDAQIYQFPHGSDEDKAAVHVVLEQDRVALEELQRRYDQFGDTSELNIVTDEASLLSRRIMNKLRQADAAAPEPVAA